MPLNSFESNALRLLQQKIDTYIRANADNLAIGSSLVVNDISATALAYSSAVSYIRALNDVLGMCTEVEDELMGRGKKK